MTKLPLKYIPKRLSKKDKKKQKKELLKSRKRYKKKKNITQEKTKIF